MSALTDLFTSMANKIRSKTGTATTYTPSEMASDGIDDVYDAGVASATSQITPSNASPVAMSANTGYKPTTAGYAIESYTPVSVYGSTVETVSEGIFKIEKGENFVTPKITGKTIQAITPSNSSPVDLYSANVLYSMSSAGKAVASVTSKTPSDSSPASVTANSIIQPSAAGYLVENAPIDMSNPDVTWEGNLSSNGSKTITVTQKPRLVIASTSRYGDSNGYFAFRVNDVANDKNCNAYYGSSGYVENLNVSGLTSITVSDTSVVYASNRSYTTRNAVFIWY